MQHFYLADETHATVKGDLVELKGVLYFKQDRSGFDGKATKEHVKNYPIAFQAFKDAHPDFVLPASFSSVEVGAPVSAPQAPAPVVAAPAEVGESVVADEASE